MANKVRYGLEKAYYAILDPDTGTYSTPKPLKGAVSLTLSPEGDSSNFFADNCPYVTFTTNSGYTGSLEIAALEDDAAVDLLNEKKDKIGGIYETADANPAQFCLMFEVKGNVCDQRFALYNCTVSRPEQNANTTTDSTDPDTVTLNFTAIPLEMEIGSETVKVTKYSLEKTDASAATFEAWYTDVVKPTAVAA